MLFQERAKYLRLLGGLRGASVLQERDPEERPDWDPTTTHLAMPVRRRLNPKPYTMYPKPYDLVRGAVAVSG